MISFPSAHDQSQGELSANRIDREWPYQALVRADQITAKNHDIIHEFCRGLSLCRAGTRWGGTMSYSVFCFADASHAERFCEQFGGERLIRRIAVAAACGSSGARAEPD
jgi:hypothetical protein